MKLWEKFKLAEKKKDYKTVYHGFVFVMGCTTAAQICAETYGHGVLYIGPADNTDGSFTSLVWIDK